MPIVSTVTFPSPLSAPRPGSPAVIPAAPASPPVLPVPTPRGRRAPIWLFAILAVVMVMLAAYILSFLGPAAALIGMLLALVPFAGVLVTVRIIDRWEPEPRSLLIFAIAWGAIAAAALALAVGLGVLLVFHPANTAATDALSAVVQAPIVEELAKGLGVLLIFALGRRAFDGPVDGVVYGALVGAGFAFTENILYFSQSLIEGGIYQATSTFFVRGILSPYAHAMFTAVTGFALGLAARRGRSGVGVAPMWLLGLCGAILLHALWNASAVFADFFVLYVTLQVPLFIGFVIGIVMLRREEIRLTRSRLTEYADAGWFTAGEVDMLATSTGRRHGIAWARSRPGDQAKVMKAFIADATALASARQRALSGRDSRAVEDEHAYLARATAARAALIGGTRSAA